MESTKNIVLAPWVFSFLERVRELTDGALGEWAALLEEALRGEVEGRVGSELPVHLREAPPLPDPREEGAAAFIPGLLAPVRAGFIVTRSDLARIAVDLDLGLRAGERRYALEHLLAQDAPPVLDALAALADARALRHEDRRGWLGVTADFHARRARRAARLLRELAAEEADR